MKKEIMQQWVKALRSGEYTQVDGRLRSLEPDATGQHSYCCLGVLCELHRREHNADGSDYHYKWDTDCNENGTVTTAYADHCDNLPLSVREWAGITAADPMIYCAIDDEETARSDHPISSLNDEWGWPFESLADVIEEQWVNL